MKRKYLMAFIIGLRSYFNVTGLYMSACLSFRQRTWKGSGLIFHKTNNLLKGSSLATGPIVWLILISIYYFTLSPVYADSKLNREIIEKIKLNSEFSQMRMQERRPRVKDIYKLQSRGSSEVWRRWVDEHIRQYLNDDDFSDQYIAIKNLIFLDVHYPGYNLASLGRDVVFLTDIYDAIKLAIGDDQQSFRIELSGEIVKVEAEKRLSEYLFKIGLPRQFDDLKNSPPLFLIDVTSYHPQAQLLKIGKSYLESFELSDDQLKLAKTKVIALASNSGDPLDMLPSQLAQRANSESSDRFPLHWKMKIPKARSDLWHGKFVSMPTAGDITNTQISSEIEVPLDESKLEAFVNLFKLGMLASSTHLQVMLLQEYWNHGAEGRERFYQLIKSNPNLKNAGAVAYLRSLGNDYQMIADELKRLPNSIRRDVLRIYADLWEMDVLTFKARDFEKWKKLVEAGSIRAEDISSQSLAADSLRLDDEPFFSVVAKKIISNSSDPLSNRSLDVYEELDSLARNKNYPANQEWRAYAAQNIENEFVSEDPSDYFVFDNLQVALSFIKPPQDLYNRLISHLISTRYLWNIMSSGNYYALKNIDAELAALIFGKFNIMDYAKNAPEFLQSVQESDLNTVIYNRYTMFGKVKDSSQKNVDRNNHLEQAMVLNELDMMRLLDTQSVQDLILSANHMHSIFNIPASGLGPHTKSNILNTPQLMEMINHLRSQLLASTKASGESGGLQAILHLYATYIGHELSGSAMSKYDLLMVKTLSYLISGSHWNYGGYSTYLPLLKMENLAKEINASNLSENMLQGIVNNIESLIRSGLINPKSLYSFLKFKSFVGKKIKIMGKQFDAQELKSMKSHEFVILYLNHLLGNINKNHQKKFHHLVSAIFGGGWVVVHTEVRSHVFDILVNGDRDVAYKFLFALINSKEMGADFMYRLRKQQSIFKKILERFTTEEVFDLFEPVFKAKSRYEVMRAGELLATTMSLSSASLSDLTYRAHALSANTKVKFQRGGGLYEAALVYDLALEKFGRGNIKYKVPVEGNQSNLQYLMSLKKMHMRGFNPGLRDLILSIQVGTADEKLKSLVEKTQSFKCETRLAI